MEKMLINATHPEEIRVALINKDYLYDLDIERPADVKKKANIYKGRITRIEPSLEAAFVDYGAKRQGFLPLKEIAPEYHRTQNKEQEASGEKPSIKSLLREGQELMVQVDKEERGNKGAALTTYITLAGCYLVLMPNNPRSGGISRRIEGEERDELKASLNQLNLPDGMGLIVRTAGVGKRYEDLKWDLEFLVNQWEAIQNAFNKQPAPFLIHQEGDVVIRSIRDNLRKSVQEIIIDNQEAYVKAKQYIEQVKPDFLPHLMLYQDTVPLFTRYQVESQIETAYQREVTLPSGGSLVIDRTEALVSIDINSAKATGGSNIETTAVNTNLEAADEIARQLRIRDLGGLVVIDFIDMSSNSNQREVENRLKEALKTDRARIQVGRISRFGLLEMSRQRLRLSLSESNQEPCPRCDGRGMVRSVYSHTLSLIRLIEEEALKDNTKEVQIQLPVEIATYLLNEKRDVILGIERRHRVDVLVLPNPHIQAPNYKLARIKTDSNTRRKASYAIVAEPELKIIKSKTPQQAAAKPAIAPVTTRQQRPNSSPASEGFIKRLWNSLFGAEASAEQPVLEEVKKRTPPQRQGSQQQQRNQDRRNQGNRNSGNRRRRGNNRNRGGQNQGNQSQGNQSQGNQSQGNQSQGNQSRQNRQGTQSNKPRTTQHNKVDVKKSEAKTESK